MKVTEEDLRMIVKDELEAFFNQNPDMEEELLGENEEEKLKATPEQPRLTKDQVRGTCARFGMYDLPRLLKTMNDISLAASGKLVPPPKRRG